MFSAPVIGILVAISVATWVYTKTMRQTGNNNQSSIITAAVAGVISFVVIVTIVIMIDKSLAD